MKWLLILFTLTGQPVDPTVLGQPKLYDTLASCDITGGLLASMYNYGYDCVKQ